MADIIRIPIEYDFSRAERSAQAAATRLRKTMSKSTSGVGGRSPLGKITANLSEFDKSLEASNARVLAFGASTSILYGFSKAMKGIVSTSIEVEQELAKINVILKVSDESLSKFGSNLFSIASKTGSSFKDVAQAAAEFSRQGLGMSRVLEATTSAMVLTRLTGMQTAEAVKSLTAAVNTFIKEGLSYEDVVNRMSSVDASFAVSSEDLIRSLQRAGAVAGDAKVNFNELIAMTASLQQSTARGGSIIGNGLKSIFTRLQRSKVQDYLNSLGVATQNAMGEFRSAIDVLSDYARISDQLTDSQRSHTAELVAGVFQINTFKGLISDLKKETSNYSRALQIAGSTTDEAFKKNEKLNKTLSAQINAASQSVKELAVEIGKLGVTSGISGLVGQFKDITETAGKGLKGDSIGADIGKGLVKGIASVLTGPGLVFIGKAIMNLSRNLMVDVFKGGKSVLLGQSQRRIAVELERINKQKMAVAQRVEAMQKNNNQLLNQGNTIIKNEVANTRSLAKAQIGYNSALGKTFSLLSKIGIGGAAVAGKTGKKPKAMASGFVPAEIKEFASISKGVGGVTKGAKPVPTSIRMKSGGPRVPIIANSQEVVVRNFAGSSADAVFNPKMVREAGGMSIVSKMGKIQHLASGYVPNFAAPRRFKMTRGDMLTEAKHLTYGESGSYAHLNYGQESGKIHIDYIKAEKRGEGFPIFKRTVDYAKKMKKLYRRPTSVIMDVLLPQNDRMIDAQMMAVVRDNYAAFETIFPQIKFMKIGGTSQKIDLSVPNLINKKGISLEEARKVINDTPLSEFMSYLTRDRVYVNNAIVSPLAGGFVPNFAVGKNWKMLGEGNFAKFFDTQKRIGGKPLGMKVFSDSVSNQMIREEYEISKELYRKFGDRGAVVAPEIFGSYENVMRKRVIPKEVMQRGTALESTLLFSGAADEMYAMLKKVTPSKFKEFESRYLSMGSNPNLAFKGSLFSSLEEIFMVLSGKKTGLPLQDLHSENILTQGAKIKEMFLDKKLVKGLVNGTMSPADFEKMTGEFVKKNKLKYGFSMIDFQLGQHRAPDKIDYKSPIRGLLDYAGGLIPNFAYGLKRRPLFNEQAGSLSKSPSGFSRAMKKTYGMLSKAVEHNPIELVRKLTDVDYGALFSNMKKSMMPSYSPIKKMATPRSIKAGGTRIYEAGGVATSLRYDGRDFEIGHLPPNRQGAKLFQHFLNNSARLERRGKFGTGVVMPDVAMDKGSVGKALGMIGGKSRAARGNAITALFPQLEWGNFRSTRTSFDFVTPDGVKRFSDIIEARGYFKTIPRLKLSKWISNGDISIKNLRTQFDKKHQYYGGSPLGWGSGSNAPTVFNDISKMGGASGYIPNFAAMPKTNSTSLFKYMMSSSKELKSVYEATNRRFGLPEVNFKELKEAQGFYYYGSKRKPGVIELDKSQTMTDLIETSAHELGHSFLSRHSLGFMTDLMKNKRIKKGIMKLVRRDARDNNWKYYNQRNGITESAQGLDKIEESFVQMFADVVTKNPNVPTEARRFVKDKILKGVLRMDDVSTFASGTMPNFAIGNVFSGMFAKMVDTSKLKQLGKAGAYGSFYAKEGSKYGWKVLSDYEPSLGFDRNRLLDEILLTKQIHEALTKKPLMGSGGVRLLGGVGMPDIDKSRMGDWLKMGAYQKEVAIGQTVSDFAFRGGMTPMGLTVDSSSGFRKFLGKEYGLKEAADIHARNLITTNRSVALAFADPSVRPFLKMGKIDKFLEIVQKRSGYRDTSSPMLSIVDAASGYMPNFAMPKMTPEMRRVMLIESSGLFKKLGEGRYGIGYQSKRDQSKVAKVFKRRDEDVFIEEFTHGKLLANRLTKSYGGKQQLIAAPNIYDSLEKSLSRMTMIKDLAPGKTMHDIANEYKFYEKFFNSIGRRISEKQLRNRISDVVLRDVNSRTGLKTWDYNWDNLLMTNPSSLMKLTEKGVARRIAEGKISNEEILKLLTGGAKGGKPAISVIDFMIESNRMKPDHRQWFPKGRFDSVASGFIPNFAIGQSRALKDAIMREHRDMKTPRLGNDATHKPVPIRLNGRKAVVNTNEHVARKGGKEFVVNEPMRNKLGGIDGMKSIFDSIDEIGIAGRRNIYNYANAKIKNFADPEEYVAKRPTSSNNLVPTTQPQNTKTVQPPPLPNLKPLEDSAKKAAKSLEGAGSASEKNAKATNGEAKEKARQTKHIKKTLTQSGFKPKEIAEYKKIYKERAKEKLGFSRRGSMKDYDARYGSGAARKAIDSEARNSMYKNARSLELASKRRGAFAKHYGFGELEGVQREARSTVQSKYGNLANMQKTMGLSKSGAKALRKQYVSAAESATIKEKFTERNAGIISKREQVPLANRERVLGAIQGGEVRNVRGLKKYMNRNFSGADIARMEKSDPGFMKRAKKITRQTRNQRTQGTMMGLSFMLPMAGQAFSSFTGEEAYGQAAMNVGTGLALGSMFGGPVGAGVGAAIGGVMAVGEYLKKTQNPLEKFSKSAQKAAEDLQNFSSASNGAIQAFSNYASVMNSTDSTESQRKFAIEQRTKAFSKLDIDTILKISSAQTPEEFQGIIQAEMEKKSAKAKQSSSLSSLSQSVASSTSALDALIYTVTGSGGSLKDKDMSAAKTSITDIVKTLDFNQLSNLAENGTQQEKADVGDLQKALKTGEINKAFDAMRRLGLVSNETAEGFKTVLDQVNPSSYGELGDAMSKATKAAAESAKAAKEEADSRKDMIIATQDIESVIKTSYRLLSKMSIKSKSENAIRQTQISLMSKDSSIKGGYINRVQGALDMKGIETRTGNVSASVAAQTSKIIPMLIERMSGLTEKRSDGTSYDDIREYRSRLTSAFESKNPQTMVDELTTIIKEVKDRGGKDMEKLIDKFEGMKDEYEKQMKDINTLTQQTIITNKILTSIEKKQKFDSLIDAVLSSNELEVTNAVGNSIETRSRFLEQTPFEKRRDEWSLKDAVKNNDATKVLKLKDKRAEVARAEIARIETERKLRGNDKYGEKRLRKERKILAGRKSASVFDAVASDVLGGINKLEGDTPLSTTNAVNKARAIVAAGDASPKAYMDALKVLNKEIKSNPNEKIDRRLSGLRNFLQTNLEDTRSTIDYGVVGEMTGNKDISNMKTVFEKGLSSFKVDKKAPEEAQKKQARENTEVKSKLNEAYQAMDEGRWEDAKKMLSDKKIQKAAGGSEDVKKAVDAMNAFMGVDVGKAYDKSANQERGGASMEQQLQKIMESMNSAMTRLLGADNPVIKSNENLSKSIEALTAQMGKEMQQASTQIKVAAVEKEEKNAKKRAGEIESKLLKDEKARGSKNMAQAKIEQLLSRNDQAKKEDKNGATLSDEGVKALEGLKSALESGDKDKIVSAKKRVDDLGEDIYSERAKAAKKGANALGVEIYQSSKTLIGMGTPGLAIAAVKGRSIYDYEKGKQKQTAVDLQSLSDSTKSVVLGGKEDILLSDERKKLEKEKAVNARKQDALAVEKFGLATTKNIQSTETRGQFDTSVSEFESSLQSRIQEAEKKRAEIDSRIQNAGDDENTAPYFNQLDAQGNIIADLTSTQSRLRKAKAGEDFKTYKTDDYGLETPLTAIRDKARELSKKEKDEEEKKSGGEDKESVSKTEVTGDVSVTVSIDGGDLPKDVIDGIKGHFEGMLHDGLRDFNDNPDKFAPIGTGLAGAGQGMG